jgi:hypothetical protein
MGTRTKVAEVKHFGQDKKPTTSLSVDMEDSVVGEDGFAKPTSFYLTLKGQDGSTVTMKLTYSEVADLKFRLEEALLYAAQKERMVKLKAYEEYRKAQEEQATAEQGEAEYGQENTGERQTQRIMVARPPIQPTPAPRQPAQAPKQRDEGRGRYPQ